MWNKHKDIKTISEFFYVEKQKESWETWLIFTPKEFLLLFLFISFEITISFLIRARDPSFSRAFFALVSKIRNFYSRCLRGQTQ